jgi:hypothetical protein
MQMTNFKDIVFKHGRDGKTEVMEELTEMVSDFIDEVKEHHPEKAHNFIMMVDLLLNPHFTKETAYYAVSNMKNKDGSIGEHWSRETTDRVLESRGYEFNHCDWYYVLNMMYSDYYKSGRSDDTYIELAYDFLSDEDGPKDKAKKYYKAMHY